MKLTKAELVARVRGWGMSTSEFSVAHEGAYLPADASWNYKDLLHLNHVHRGQARAVYSPVEDDVFSCIILQKVLGLRVPMAATSYSLSESGQVYFASMLWFVLIVETTFEPTGPLRTRVTTSYCVGAPLWLAWCLPVFRWLLKRNYRSLMEGDVPMRERRGQLRSWGFSFSTDGCYSSERGLDTARVSVVAPKGPPPEPLSLPLSELADGSEKLIGRDDHHGLRLVRRGSAILVYPRLCDHEGASLDGQPCAGDRVLCPWHGRANPPLARFDLAAGPQRARSPRHDLALEEGRLRVVFRP